MQDWTISQWTLMAVGAFVVGLSKCGLPGVGILAIPLFASVLPARASTGMLLPILLVGDIISVAYYRREADWKHLRRVLPWAVAGVLIGWRLMGRISDGLLSPLIGGIVLLMLILNWWLRRHPDLKDISLPDQVWYPVCIGLIAGITTMLANAAGPIMIIYLLATRLPPIAFIGTSAWYFLLVNAFKIPFSASLGLITPGTAKVNLVLVPFVGLGAAIGILFARRVPKQAFEALMQLLAAAGALKLMF